MWSNVIVPDVGVIAGDVHRFGTFAFNCNKKMFHDLLPCYTSYKTSDLTENGLLIMCKAHQAVHRIMTGFQ